MLTAETLKTRQIRDSFPVVPGQVLRLANLAGRVELVPGTGPAVEVEATIHAQGQTEEESESLLSGMGWAEGRDEGGHPQLLLSYPVERYPALRYPLAPTQPSAMKNRYGGREVRIDSRERKGIPTLYADLRIAVPAGAALAIRNVAGPVHGTRLEAALEVTTGGGEVRLDSIAGGLEASTGDGSITVGRLAGDGTLSTGSGAVEVGRLAGGRLEVNTGSGGVLLRGGEAAAASVTTGSGSVRMQGVEAGELLAATGDGDIVLEGSLANTRQVDFGTGSGDVRIVADRAASFAIESLEGGELVVGYADAVLDREGRRVVGARRGDGKTQISVRIGRGKCSIAPQ